MSASSVYVIMYSTEWIARIGKRQDFFGAKLFSFPIVNNQVTGEMFKKITGILIKSYALIVQSVDICIWNGSS